MKFSTEGIIEIEDEYLKHFFEHPEVAQRKIVALSIIGTFRKGNSFFMNYCLRYLYANVRNFIILFLYSFLKIKFILVPINKTPKQ